MFAPFGFFFLHADLTSTAAAKTTPSHYHKHIASSPTLDYQEDGHFVAMTYQHLQPTPTTTTNTTAPHGTAGAGLSPQPSTASSDYVGASCFLSYEVTPDTQVKKREGDFVLQKYETPPKRTKQEYGTPSTAPSIEHKNLLVPNRLYDGQCKYKFLDAV